MYICTVIVLHVAMLRYELDINFFLAGSRKAASFYAINIVGTLHLIINDKIKSLQTQNIHLFMSKINLVMSI